MNSSRSYSIRQIEAASELLARARARRDFLSFIRYTKPNYEVNWHNEIICNALQRCYQGLTEGKDQRLLIRTPPRGGKSEIVSRRFPPWIMGNQPDWQVIATSYNDGMAMDNAGDAKTITAERRYQVLFPSLELRQDTQSKALWKTTAGGVYAAAGVGGGITGKGAHILIIDDPYKDAKDAWSPVVRKGIWNWLTTTALTRLMPVSAVIVLLTSWHDDGLDNHILRDKEEVGENWNVIDIPAIMEANYQGRHAQDTRKAGESYWPSRWPVDKLAKLRRRLGPNAWSALYQQRAIPDGGNIIRKEWIKFWRKEPVDLEEIIISADLAFKGSKESSRVAFQVWGRRKEDFFLLKRDTRVREFVETLTDFKKLVRDNPRARVKLVEDKANGPALQSMLQHEVSGIVMVPVEQDKPGRLRAVAPIFASGNVYLPDPAVHPWCSELVEELVRMPNSEYNDDADVVSQTLGWWNVPGQATARWKEWKL